MSVVITKKQLRNAQRTNNRVQRARQIIKKYPCDLNCGEMIDANEVYCRHCAEKIKMRNLLIYAEPKNYYKGIFG